MRAGRLALLGAAVGAGAVARRHALVRRVPVDLRMRSMYVPMSVRTGVDLRLVRRMLGTATDPGEGVTITTLRTTPGPDGHAPTVHVVVPDERADGAGALLWVHGGGLVAGVAARDHAGTARVARELGIVVVNVEYRLAPEHPFPAALEDCHAALVWLATEAAALGVDAGRLAVGGASAGGGLAAALAQLAHDRGEVDVAFQLLVYPMLDDRTVGRDVSRRRWLVWTPASNRFGWTSYLGRPPGSADVPPLAAPARRADLAGLPPAWVGVGDLDLFHDEDVDYARRLREAGVPCDLHVQRGMYHAADVALEDRAGATAEFRAGALAALRAHVVPAG